MLSKDGIKDGDLLLCHDGRIGKAWHPEWTLGLFVKFEDGTFKYYFKDKIDAEKI